MVKNRETFYFPSPSTKCYNQNPSTLADCFKSVTAVPGSWYVEERLYEKPSQKR